MATNQNSEFPSPYDFFIKVPLYTTFNIDESNSELIKEIENFSDTIDTYCIECKKHSTFHRVVPDTIEALRYVLPSLSSYNLTLNNKYNRLSNRIFIIIFSCTRNENHRIEFYFKVYNEIMQKIGQFPSRADLTIPEMGKYKKILGKKYKEFIKALGLASHGVGIGSFVYLRRIFEELIEEAHREAMKIDSWNEENYNRSRMHEKIDLLKEYLPEFLVKNKTIYPILSKGIHELSEDECLKYFDTVKVVIELILDEKLEKLDREAKIKEAEKSLSEIHSELK
jgi:hypothetical protein